MTEINTLDGLTTGRYKVTTASGTQHVVDLDAKTATRYGAPGRQWGEKVLVADPHTVLPGSRPKLAVHYVTVTPDGNPFHFTSIQDATVGKCMHLDNADEWRITSTIKSIELIEND